MEPPAGADVPDSGEVALVVVAAIVPAGPASTEWLTRDLGLRTLDFAPGSLPMGPELLAVRPLPPQEGRPAVVLLLGGDERGLSYALLESARRVELEGPGPGAGPVALLDCFPPTAEAPQRPLRSLCVFPHNAVLDQEWYSSLDFWRWYFDLLALHRFNRFTLTFGHQTAYLAPPYPFFVPVPEHPEVRPTGFDARAREEHLALLQGIAGLAVERGLDFCLGIWSQHAHSYGPSTVSGLDQDNLASYCAAGLRRLLEACPQVSAVQLRLNAELGVPPGRGGQILAGPLRRRRRLRAPGDTRPAGQGHRR